MTGVQTCALPISKGPPFSTSWSHHPVLKGVRWRRCGAGKFSPTSLAEGRPHLLISPAAAAFSSSSLLQALWAYLFYAALWAYWAFAGLHPGPTTGRVSSRMQAAVAQ